MPFNRPTLNEIWQRAKADLESRVTGGQKIVRVSMLGVIGTVLSGASHMLHGFLEQISKEVFVDTASELGLTRWGNILNLPRKAPVYTTGTVYFAGVIGYTVPAGTSVVNSDGYEYTTDSAYVIPAVLGSTTVDVTAVEEGTTGNTEDTALSLSEASTSIETEVPVVSGFDNGTDLETLEAWVQRLLQRLQNPPSSGNESDYIRWALEVEGVEKAWCEPAYAGAGTVGVLVSKSDFQGVGSTILADVESYVETVKPVPSVVYYIDTVPVDTDYEISVTPNTPEMQALIEEKLDDMHKIESGPGQTILLSRIRAAIASAGPTDYDITGITVDSVAIGVTDITSTIPEAPAYNSVTFSDL